MARRTFAFLLPVHEVHMTPMTIGARDADGNEPRRRGPGGEAVAAARMPPAAAPGRRGAL